MRDKLIEILVELCEDEIVRKNMDIELFETGLLDSLTFAELLFAIESNFNIIIAPSSISREDISSPRRILELLEKRSS